MPIITRIVQGKKNPNRVNLYLDDEFAFAISLDELARHNLKKGQVITEYEVVSLKDNDESEYVYSKILNFLSFRPRTKKEVRDRLLKYDYSDPQKQLALIARLTQAGYLDDISFARWFIASRNTHRPRSIRMLFQELLAKGVSREDVSIVIDEVQDEGETIRHLLAKKLKSQHILDISARQKIYGYLARLGFAWDKITAVVKKWESE